MAKKPAFVQAFGRRWRITEREVIEPGTRGEDFIPQLGRWKLSAAIGPVAIAPLINPWVQRVKSAIGGESVPVVYGRRRGLAMLTRVDIEHQPIGVSVHIHVRGTGPLV